MNRKLGSMVILFVLALVASACGGGGSDLTYKVLGTASEAKVEYKNAKGETETETVTLPWETDFGIGSDFSFKISVENESESGSVTCEVWVNERRVGGTSGVRMVECSGSFSGSKNSSFTDYRGRYDAKPKDAVVTMDEQDASMATSAARAATRTAAAAPTPTATPPPTATAAPLPPITDFETYTHDMDCAVHNKDLKLRAFSVLYPSGAVIQDCTENPENYVVFSLDPDENSESAAFSFALGKLEFTPPDRATYVSNANRFLSMISTQLASQYAAENLSSDPIAYQGEIVFHQDMKAVVEDIPRLIRLVTIPNYDHGHGVFFIAMQKVDGAPEEAFPAFDQVTRKIIESIEFAPVEPTIGDVTFATDITLDSEAIDPATSFSAGTTKVYGVFEYTDLYPGMELVFAWYVDGEEVYSDAATWDDKSSGRTWANFYNNDGMAPGEYEVRLSVNGELAQTGGFVVQGSSAGIWYQEGVEHYEQGEYEEALDAFSQAIELDPDYAKAYKDRGVVYFLLDESEQAIADINQAIAIDPDYVHAYYNRAIIYKAQGDLERALSDYDQAIAIDPDYVVAYVNRGVIYAGQGEYDRAIADYDQAIALQPGFDMPYLNRGIAYINTGDTDSAIADLRKVLEISQNPAIRQMAEEKLESLGVGP